MASSRQASGQNSEISFIAVSVFWSVELDSVFQGIDQPVVSGREKSDRSVGFSFLSPFGLLPLF